jgi:hypothetical protein
MIAAAASVAMKAFGRAEPFRITPLEAMLVLKSEAIAARPVTRASRRVRKSDALTSANVPISPTFRFRYFSEYRARIVSAAALVA